MKKILFAGALVALLLLAAPSVLAQKAPSTSASATWGNSASVSNGLALRAFALKGYLLRHRIGPYSTARLIYTDNSTNYNNSTTNCSVTGGCQTGGSTVAINGYTSQTTNGNNNSTTTTVTTTHTGQSGTATSVAVPGNIPVGTTGGGH